MKYNSPKLVDISIGFQVVEFLAEPAESQRKTINDSCFVIVGAPEPKGYIYHEVYGRIRANLIKDRSDPILYAGNTYNVIHYGNKVVPLNHEVEPCRDIRLQRIYDLDAGESVPTYLKHCLYVRSCIEKQKRAQEEEENTIKFGPIMSLEV